MFFSFTFDDLLKQNLPSNRDKVAVEMAGEVMTYGELDAAVERFAGSLHVLGVGRGTRVGIHVRKSFDEVIATFAVARLGGGFINLNEHLTTRQLGYATGHAGVSFLIAERRKASAFLSEGAPECIERVIVRGDRQLTHEHAVCWADLPVADVVPEVRVIDTDLCAVLYTSGSTGMPKGVMLPHRVVVQSAMSAVRHLQNEPDDRILGVLPLSFDFGLSQLTSACITGATLVLQPVQIPAEISRALTERRITGLATVPTIWIPLTRFMEEQGIKVPSLRYVAVSGGMPPTDVLRAWKRLFPHARKYCMYGMTEGFRSSFLAPEEFERKMGSIGKALPNVEIFIVDPEKGLCGPNEKGEILHRGSLISNGYLHNPEATEEKIRPCPHLAHLIGDEKVLYSGDTGYMDEEGFLYFVARTSTFIKSSDFRISPLEVEDIIYESGLVTDVVAFGMPDEKLGQVVHVAFSLNPTVEYEEKKMVLHCRKEMPSYMVPSCLHVWEGEMPHTPNGKVNRPLVIAHYQ